MTVLSGDRPPSGRVEDPARSGQRVERRAGGEVDAAVRAGALQQTPLECRAHDMNGAGTPGVVLLHATRR
jgi:hypothetical protein